MLDPSDEKLERLANSIGHLTINFAQLEAFLNINLSILNRMHNGKLMPKRSEYSRRVAAFRDGVQRADLSKEGKSHGLKLATDMKAIANTRHTCIHGVIAFTELDVFDPHGVTFDRMPSDGFAKTQDHLFIGEIDRAAEAAFRLAVQLLGFTAVLDHRLAERVKQTLRELLGS